MSSAWAVIQRDQEVLFVRRSFSVGRAGQWCPPGGTIWPNEQAEVACIREAYEETGLRVHVVQSLARFDGAHYFLCKLNGRGSVVLRPEECIDSAWVSPCDLLALGTVMDLRRMIPVLAAAGLSVPTPNGLVLSIPDVWY